MPARELSRLQSVQNAGARLIFSVNKYDHVSSLLRDLHWLRAPQRIDYKIAVLVYRCLHGLAPAYLSVDLQSIKDLPSSSDYGHGRRTRELSLRRTCPLSATALSRLPLHESGTLSPDVRSSSSVNFQASAQNRALLTKLP